MDWGELDAYYPLNAEVWGTAAEWVSGGFTAAAALTAAIAYASGRKQDKWAQASLIIFELGAGDLIVHNRSDRPIINVCATPENVSFWSAARSRNFHERVLFTPPGFQSSSSHEFYRNAKRTHRQIRREKRSYQSYIFANKLEPGESATVGGSWIYRNGAKGYIYFLDAQGREWKYDVQEKRRKPVKSRPSPLKLSNHTISAIGWILKHEWIHLWRNYLYHPKGRPKT